MFSPLFGVTDHYTPTVKLALLLLSSPAWL
jgi:hypothetical protein